MSVLFPIGEIDDTDRIRGDGQCRHELPWSTLEEADHWATLYHNCGQYPHHTKPVDYETGEPWDVVA